MTPPSIPVILGPTGTGKTALLQRLVESLPIEVVSCDSRQIYAEMPVGTAQPDTLTLQLLPHHLVGFLKPTDSYSAGRFRIEATAAIFDILSRKKVPVVSGGTGFYYRALRTRMIEITDDDELRSEIKQMTAEDRLKALQSEDPASVCASGGQAKAGVVHYNDSYRVERALYILRLTGRPLRSFYEDSFAERDDLRFTAVWLDVDVELWKKDIAKRARQMVDDGFVTEAESVFQKYGDCPALNTVGYSEALQCAQGEISHAELTERLTTLHFQYGKRQRSWLRSEASVLPCDKETGFQTIEKQIRAEFLS